MKILVPESFSTNFKDIVDQSIQNYGFEVVFDNGKDVLQDVDVLLMNYFVFKDLKNFLKRLPNLRFIQTLSAGVEKINFEIIDPKIILCSNAGAYSIPVAEHAISMALALAKNLQKTTKELKDGIFVQFQEGIRLKDSTALVIGYGGIGGYIGKLCEGLGMKVIKVGRNRSKTERKMDGTLDDIGSFLTSADFVFICTPSNKYTKNLFDGEMLSKMKEDSVLVNIARADIIDQEALYDHMSSHPEFRAGIDVWWDEPGRNKPFEQKFPITSLPNFVGSPHNSSVVKGIFEESLKLAFENIAKFMKGEKPNNIVNREDYLND